LAGTVPARRLISIGIGVDIVLIAAVLLSGGFKLHLPWFTVRVHSLFTPVVALAGLSFARALIAKNRGKSLLLFFSLLLTFITLEAGIRALSVVLHRKSVAGLRSSREITNPPRHGRELSLGDFIQTSVNPDIVYELVPDVAARFLGKKLTINRYGFRGTPYPPRPGRDVVRIVGIGDSVMFGWGVDGEDPYLSLLEREVAAAYPHTRWQIINAAVPGYNTYMEVATLEDRLLGYKPDLVIIDYVGNDQDLPNFLQNKISPLSLRRSFLLDLIRAKVRGLTWRGLDRLVDAPRDPFGESFSSDPSRVPPVYQKMVGPEAVLRSMDRLKQLSKRHSFTVVVFSTGTITGRLRKHLNKLGFPVLEARLWHLGRSDRRACSGDSAVLSACRHFDRWLAATGFHSYGDSPLTVSPTDPHPSAMTHQALGSMLLRYLKNSGWIETERRRPERSSQKFPHEGAERSWRVDVHEVAGSLYDGYS